MERLLCVWIEDQNQCSMLMNTDLSGEGKNLCEDLKSEYGKSSEMETLSASKGWFQKFKKHHSLHHIKMHGETSSDYTKEANNYLKVLKKIVEEGATHHNKSLMSTRQDSIGNVCQIH